MTETNIAKWGNSDAVRIPEHIIKTAGMNLGDRVQIKAVGTSIVIVRKPEPKKKLHAAGILKAYSNPELRKLEKDAFEKGVAEKYAKTR